MVREQQARHRVERSPEKEMQGPTESDNHKQRQKQRKPLTVRNHVEKF